MMITRQNKLVYCASLLSKFAFFQCRYYGTTTNPGFISKLGIKLFKPPVQVNNYATSFTGNIRNKDAKSEPWHLPYNHPPIHRIDCSCSFGICIGTCFVKKTNQVGHITHKLPSQKILNQEKNIGLNLSSNQSAVLYTNNVLPPEHYTYSPTLTKLLQNHHKILLKNTICATYVLENQKKMYCIYNPKTSCFYFIPFSYSSEPFYDIPLDEEIF